jgi:DNA modification methylase
MNQEDLKYYLHSPDKTPLFVIGNSLDLLKEIPSNTIDCCITSPPYWGQRSYSGGGIGLEESAEDFIENLLKIIIEIKRVLKPSGSFWLNIGDTYQNKSLAGIPWRVAIQMTDKYGWTLRNSIIWNKHKGGMDSVNDRLRNVHENIFHFVKSQKGYFYDANAIRSKPRQAIVKNGSIISATGVTGISYKRKIELSTSLNDEEKKNAFEALNGVLVKITTGEVTDFRMIIRDHSRATHSDMEKVSGRAKELKNKGFYFLFYNPNGTLPTDVWDIIPEDTHKREKHYAVFPEDLCKLPILSTCPQNGIILDPFCGTGTTNKVAFDLNRKSIGFDLSADYIEIAQNRNKIPQYSLFNEFDNEL